MDIYGPGLSPTTYMLGGGGEFCSGGASILSVAISDKLRGQDWLLPSEVFGEAF